MIRLNQDCYRRLVVFLALVALISFSGLAEAAPWSFAVLGDQRDVDGSTGINTPVIQAMVNDIVQNRGVSLVLCGGDQIHGEYGAAPAPLPTMYQNWRTAMGPVLDISYPVRGNHETYGETHTPYYPHYWDTCIAKVLTQIPQNGPADEIGMTFSFSNQNAFFVGVDQFMPGYENQVNQPWLDQQLSANILPHVFVYGHEPAVAVTEALSSLAYYPVNRDAFWESLGSGGAQVYLCGHSHVYNRATITITDSNKNTTPPITQLIVGGGGGPLEAWDGNYYTYQKHGGQPPISDVVTPTLENHLENQFGYAVVTLDGNQVDITYYAGLPSYSSSTPVPTSWAPYETFNYTITAKTLGLNDVSQQISPQILTDYYPGIAINKIGSGTLTLNAGNSSYSEPITVSGGKIKVYGGHPGAPVTVNSGAETALHGGSINNVAVNAGGNLVGTGTVTGSLANNGHVSPGLATGPWDLNVTGSFTQTATANLNVDIASATDYGQMQVTGGTANLNGIVYVTMQNHYAPTANQIFPNIITASGGLNGTFIQIGNPVITPSLSWQPIYTANSFGLQAVPNSVVPQLDLLLLSWLKPPSWYEVTR